MKKILCVIVCLLCLSGCGKQNAKDVQNTVPEFSGISAQVTAVMNGIEMKAKVDYIGFDSLSLQFTAPETVKDMKVICEDGECEAFLNELSFAFSSGSLPYKSVCICLADCIEKAKTLPIENNCITYKEKGYNCRLELDDSAGNFQGLYIDGECVLTFSEFEYYTVQE